MRTDGGSRSQFFNFLPAQERAVPAHEAAAVLGMGRSSFYSLMRPDSKNFDPNFPKPIRVSARRVVWLYSSLVSWLEARSQVSTDGGAK
ncbi:helix-turn-helix transcriptional regulator [Hydrogenophaga laconesensis]|uniref:DNA-binding transcriptional regulator AlpA n=1 Tax=Hydrogenophaga laconesensis TaxID=1805971 RepID=A0ABU1VDV8_9BURK|nr:AlpA family phage regulatory protein [Hydrogenophaga laconesensis]MDR7095647.1 putative DNA-binding transcriptional regulator AlpA [Hydrogenophaga laconesensis]